MDQLLRLIFRAASVEPAVDGDLCLTARRSSAVCTACKDACPHEAITVRREVTIDPVECSGCGLCVQACPSQAVEPRVAYQRGASLRCSRVAGDAQSVHCLGRLRPTDLLRLAGSRDELVLAHAGCADCAIGGAAVLEALERVREEARELAALHGRSLAVELRRAERLDQPTSAEALSRRQLLRGAWRNVQHGASDLLAPLDPGDDDPQLPVELQRRYRVIEAARPEPEAAVPWVLPRIADNCIMCPLCTNACPTGAIERDFAPEGKEGSVLRLAPERCMGCAACADACPVHAVSLDAQVSWSELSGGWQEAFHKDPRRGAPGAVSR